MSHEVDFAELEGVHHLTGVDVFMEKVHKYGDAYEDANGLLFTLDGVTYLAIEDPEDGYRSCLGSFYVVEAIEPSNKFPPVEVMVYVVGPDNPPVGEYYGNSHILEMVSPANGKLILAVGTSNVGDYYPGYVGIFAPENMPINEGKA